MMKPMHMLVLICLLFTAPAGAQEEVSIVKLVLEGDNSWSTVDFKPTEGGGDHEHSIWAGLPQSDGLWRVRSHSTLDFQRTRIELEFHVPPGESELQYIPTLGSIGESDPESPLERYLMSGVCEVMPSLFQPELVECALTIPVSRKRRNWHERMYSSPVSMWIRIDLDTLEVDAEVGPIRSMLLPGSLRVVSN